MNLLSTYYLGEAYANFGLLGTIISPIYISVLITTIYQKMLKFYKYPWIVGVFAYTIIPSSVSSQFNNFIYNPIAVALVLILTLIIILSSRDNHLS